MRTRWGLLVAAAALLAVGASCKDKGDREIAPPGSEREEAAPAPPDDARARDAAPPDAVPAADAPAEPEPAWLAELAELAELMCTCTTPSCTYRFNVKIHKAREQAPESPDERWKRGLAAVEERIAGCSDVASADGLAKARDAGAKDGSPAAE